MFNDLRLEVKFVHFVNIGGSVDQITVLPFFSKLHIYNVSKCKSKPTNM
jgi:hypothetical protein